MKIQVIIGSVREGRTAIKVARWVQKSFEKLELNTVQLELVDLTYSHHQTKSYGGGICATYAIKLITPFDATLALTSIVA